MATGTNGKNIITETTENAAVCTLFSLLRNNLYNSHYENYDICHQERMACINKVLQSDGGKNTVESLIDMINQQIEISKKEAQDAHAKDIEYGKKHPFKSFKSFWLNRPNEYHTTYGSKMNFLNTLAVIRSELNAALNLVNVIELSGMANKPKVG